MRDEKEYSSGTRRSPGFLGRGREESQRSPGGTQYGLAREWISVLNFTTVVLLVKSPTPGPGQFTSLFHSLFLGSCLGPRLSVSVVPREWVSGSGSPCTSVSSLHPWSLLPPPRTSETPAVHPPTPRPVSREELQNYFLPPLHREKDQCDRFGK